MKSTDLPSGIVRSGAEDAVPGTRRDGDDREGDSGGGDGDGSGAAGHVPIGVSEGDFSTPTRRSRKITRPRGLKALEVPPAVEATGDADGRPGAEPDGFEPAISGALREAAQNREASAVDEFLAAPPTPVPELENTPPAVPMTAASAGAALDEPGWIPGMAATIPPPEQNNGDHDSEISSETNSDSDGEDHHVATTNEEAAAPGDGMPAPAPRLPSEPFGIEDEEVAVDLGIAVPIDSAEPAIEPAIGPANGLDRLGVESSVVEASFIESSAPPPEAPSIFEPGPDEAPGALAEPPGAPFEAASVAAAAPPSEPGHVALQGVLDDALSESPSQAAVLETSSLSPLALTLAHMAEALHSDLGYEPADDIELLEAPVVVLAPEAPRLNTPPNTPPPVPRHIKAPPPDRTPSPISVPPTTSTLPEALAERPRQPKRSKPWYEEIFDENYLRTLPFMTAGQTLREVDFIQASLNLGKGSRLLDVGCGYGRHAIELVQRGLAVTAVDLSLPLLMRAAEESQRRGLAVDFVHGDMRKMAFERQFDGAYCMLTTFGYFDEESNLEVAEAIGRALKPGGRLLLDVVNRDYIVGDLPARTWWEGDGCVVLEEVEFNFNTNRLKTHRSVVFDDGRQLDQEISLRAYCLHDLGKLLRQAGFRVLEVSGSIFTKGHFFGATSRNLLIAAERRAD